MGRSLVLFVFVVLGGCYVQGGHKLPDDFHKCNAKDPKIGECLQSAIIDAIQKMKSGKKSLGVLPLDPLKVDALTLDLGTGQAPFLFKAKNVVVTGLSESKITKVDFKPEKFVLEYTSLTPKAQFDFNYEATGRILLLPVNGEGPGKFTFTDMLATHHLEGTLTKKDGRSYWKISTYDLKFDAKKLDIHLEGLLKGNKEVSNQLSEFLLKEWRIFLDQLRGPAGDAFGAIFLDLSNRIFSRVPYGDVFPGADDLIA